MRGQTLYMPDQTGMAVIVTGSNAGVGFETALALYGKGAHVPVAAMKPEKC